MARVHPLLERYASEVEDARAITAPGAVNHDLHESYLARCRMLVELYDALAQAPVGKPPPAPQAGIARVTTVLAVLGFRQPPPDHPGASADFYLARGQALHRACELDDTGALDERTVDAEIAAHVRGWRKFKANSATGRSCWWERRFTCPRLGLTGRPDNLRFLRGVRTLLDIKTNDVDPATVYQLAFYEMLMRASGGVLMPARWVGLALRPDDYRVHWYTDDEMAQARADAQAMLRTYHARVRLAA
jgi:hypothetical protein